VVQSFDMDRWGLRAVRWRERRKLSRAWEARDPDR
jgi:hypothetical protein